MDDSELTALSMEWLAQKGFEVTKKKIRPRHCPLCGGKAYTIYSNDEDGFRWWYTYCDSCKIRNEGYKTEEEAIEAWNALPRGDQRA